MLEYLSSTFWESLNEQIMAIFDREERIYGLFLLSSLALALVYYLIAKRKESPTLQGRSFWRLLFPQGILRHPSTKTDVLTFFINNLIKSFLIAPFFISGLGCMYMVVKLWESQLGTLDTVSWPNWLIVLLYTTCLVVISDLSRFILHYALHKIPFLWSIHQYHHSAELLSPLTLYRVHPIEYFLFKMRAVFSFGIVTGSFYFFFRGNLNIWTIMGSNGIVFLFNLLGANLRHSHVPIRYGNFLEHIFISPAQHQIHHGKSNTYFDKNFGSLFSFWDWMAGTLHISSPNDKIEFGVKGVNSSFTKLLLAPFLFIYQRFKPKN